MRTAKMILIHSILPIILGGLLYILIRPSNLLMFKWFEVIKLTGLFEHIRTVLHPFVVSFPPFIYNSLPDGLWVYSITVCLGLMWLQGTKWERGFFYSAGPIMGFVIEIGQLYNFVPGTFDVTDFVFVLVASIAAVLLVEKERRREYE
jgi:hypothetical protein